MSSIETVPTRPAASVLPLPLAGLLLMAACASGPAVAGELAEGDPEAGKAFYRTGLVGDGKPVPVTVQGDVQASSDRFPCAACHRPSGFGSSEGGEYVPIITRPVLFGPRRADRERRNRRFLDLFKETHSSNFDARVRMPRMRPAYTEETLAKAIRGGVDAGGQPLSHSMPRYHLSDQAIADLIAYLKTLSVTRSPGVGKDTLHLATIVSAGVKPAQREAVISTLRAFTRWYNEDIRGQLANEGFSPYYRSEFKDSFRQWQLHVWQLEGPRETWGEQLREHYARHPVFAVVSGMVDGPWQTVHDFCEGERLPCVFPNTQLPNIEDARYGYSIHFSRGLSLEAEALAKYLGGQDDPPRQIRQIHADQPAGSVPAEAFAQTLERYLPTPRTTTVTASETELGDAIASAAEASADLLVIWPGEETKAAVQALNAHPPEAQRIVLPSSALPAARESLSQALASQVRLTYPYEKPTAYHPRKYRVRAWFGSRGLTLTHPRLQLEAYYAMTQMQYSIGGLVNDFYRDYLVEFIEQQAEAELNPGTHPTLALGPGQRFASKGAYIVALEPDGDHAGYKAVSEWIVP